MSTAYLIIEDEYEPVAGGDVCDTVRAYVSISEDGDFRIAALECDGRAWAGSLTEDEKAKLEERAREEADLGTDRWEAQQWDEAQIADLVGEEPSRAA